MSGRTEYKNSNEIVLISETFQQASWRVKCDTVTVQCDECYGHYKPDHNTAYKLFSFFIYYQKMIALMKAKSIFH